MPLPLTEAKLYALEQFETGRKPSEMYQDFPLKDCHPTTVRKWFSSWKKENGVVTPPPQAEPDQELTALYLEAKREMEELAKNSTWQSMIQDSDRAVLASIGPDPQHYPVGSESPQDEGDRLQAEISQLGRQIAQYERELAALEATPIIEPRGDAALTPDQLLQQFESFERACSDRSARIRALTSTIEALSQRLDGSKLAYEPYRQARATQAMETELAAVEAALVPIESEIMHLTERLKEMCHAWYDLSKKGNAAWSRYCGAVPTTEFRHDKVYAADQLALPQVRFGEGAWQYRRVLQFSRQEWPGQAFIASASYLASLNQ